MEYYLLASGSKGNCFILKDKDVTIGIDCGTSIRYLSTRLEEIHVDAHDLDALFITHSHKDHINAVKLFEGVNIYSPNPIDEVDTIEVKPFEYMYIHDIRITPIPLSHDAPNTTGYVFETPTEKLVYITDTGYINTSYLSKFMDADYIVLESNHDIEMLMQTERPHFLKKRIYGDLGHLNNEDCASTLEAIVSSKTKHIILAHISEKANTPEKALEVTKEHLLENAHESLNPALVISAAKQREIIKGGSSNEENYYGSCCCAIGMECRTNS